MRRRSIDKEVMVLLITTLITVLTWTGMEVYRAYKKVALPENVEVYLRPIDPVVDTGVFDELNSLKP